MLSGIFLCSLKSDQLYAWSDTHPKRIRSCASEASPYPCRPGAAASIDSAGLAYRTLQAMRQARMQMRRWSRTWTQILPFRKSPGSPSTDGLCASGSLQAGFRASRQLSANQRDSRGDQRDQPRVAASSRGTLRRHHEPAAGHLSCLDRCGGWRRDSRQYVGRLARRGPEEFILFGGRR